MRSTFVFAWKRRIAFEYDQIVQQKPLPRNDCRRSFLRMRYPRATACMRPECFFLIALRESFNTCLNLARRIENLGMPISLRLDPAQPLLNITASCILSFCIKQFVPLLRQLYLEARAVVAAALFC